MKLDIVSIQAGLDLGVAISEAPRAANVLSIQLGSLDFAPEFGVDLKYFLESENRIQSASFKAYLVERLLQHQINVVSVLETVQTLYRSYQFNVGSSESAGGLVT